MTTLAQIKRSIGPGVAALNPDIAPDISIAAKSTDESKLNKLEAAWLAEMRYRGYTHIGIQNMTLKLADDTRYTPDFTGINPHDNNRRCAFETKGFFRDDAKVKLKVAAREFRHVFTFFLVTRDSKSKVWTIEQVNP